MTLQPSPTCIPQPDGGHICAECQRKLLQDVGKAGRYCITDEHICCASLLCNNTKIKRKEVQSPLRPINKEEVGMESPLKTVIRHGHIQGRISHHSRWD